MEKLLTVKDLSELLSVSPKTIYHWTHTGFIPHYKLPKGVRFSLDKLDRWLASRAVKGRNSLRISIEI